MTLGNEENIWTPPYLFPVDAKVIGALICYGLLMLAPKVPEYIKALFEPKAKITPPGAAFLGGVGAGVGAGRVLLEHTFGRDIEAARKAALEERAAKFKSKEPEGPALTKWGRLLSKL